MMGLLMRMADEEYGEKTSTIPWNVSSPSTKTLAEKDSASPCHISHHQDITDAQ